VKPAFVITLVLLIGSSVIAGNKKLPPFSASLPDSQVVDILYWTNSNQVQYLGYDWINSYCFGKVLGCAVTDQPATAQYSYGEIIFRSGDWLIYATYFGDGPGMQIQMLAPCWKPSSRAQVSPAKNMQTLLVGDPGVKLHRWRGHTYTAVSALNTATKEVWGHGSLDDWRLVITAMWISKELTTLSINEQLTWSGKLSALQAAGLVTADNLEKLLIEMRNSESQNAQTQK
jgi:hypothetical protein